MRRLHNYEMARIYLDKMEEQLANSTYLRRADHLKYKEVCMEMEDGFQAGAVIAFIQYISMLIRPLRQIATDSIISKEEL